MDKGKKKQLLLFLSGRGTFILQPLSAGHQVLFRRFGLSDSGLAAGCGCRPIHSIAYLSTLLSWIGGSNFGDGVQ